MWWYPDFRSKVNIKFLFWNISIANLISSYLNLSFSRNWFRKRKFSTRHFLPALLITSESGLQMCGASATTRMQQLANNSAKAASKNCALSREELWLGLENCGGVVSKDNFYPSVIQSTIGCGACNISLQKLPCTSVIWSVSCSSYKAQGAQGSLHAR